VNCFVQVHLQWLSVLTLHYYSDFSIFLNIAVVYKTIFITIFILLFLVTVF